MKKSERVTKEKIMINILEYGAVGDGQTNYAPVIQKAIDTCAEQAEIAGLFAQACITETPEIGRASCRERV